MTELIVILILVVVIVGCRGYQRLLGNQPVEEKPAATSQAAKEIIITGELVNTNAVEISSGTVTYVEVMGYHATKYKEVVPFDPALKNTSKPYYQTNGKVILFFHVGACSYRIYIKP